MTMWLRVLAFATVGLLVVACGDADVATTQAPVAPTTVAPTTHPSPTLPSTTTTTAASTTTTAPTTTPSAPERPSQSVRNAERDGVIPELAALPLSVRTERVIGVEATEGIWALAAPTQELNDLAVADGCGFGNLEGGTYGVDVICVPEYGEVLLIDDAGRIVKAYPMPGAPPSWLTVTEAAVFTGHIGDGGLPDSTLVRIDRSTLDWQIWVIPAEIDGAESFPPDWQVAEGERSDSYTGIVGFTAGDGTLVDSPLGDVYVDLEALEAFFAGS